jgi:hypothetical protein
VTGRKHVENLSLDGRAILEMNMKKIRCDSVDWIHVAEVRDQ